MPVMIYFVTTKVKMIGGIARSMPVAMITLSMSYSVSAGGQRSDRGQ